MFTCWERVDLLVLVCNVYCVFVTFPCGILSQVWYLIVAFPYLCRLSYFSISQYALWHIVAPLSCMLAVVSIFSHKELRWLIISATLVVTRNENEQDLRAVSSIAEITVIVKIVTTDKQTKAKGKLYVSESVCQYC